MKHEVVRTEDNAASPALYWILERARTKKSGLNSELKIIENNKYQKQERKGSKGKEDKYEIFSIPMGW